MTMTNYYDAWVSAGRQRARVEQRGQAIYGGMGQAIYAWCPVCECDASVGNGHADVQCVWELKQQFVLLERRVAQLEHEAEER